MDMGFEWGAGAHGSHQTQTEFIHQSSTSCLSSLTHAVAVGHGGAEKVGLGEQAGQHLVSHTGQHGRGAARPQRVLASRGAAAGLARGRRGRHARASGRGAGRRRVDGARGAGRVAAAEGEDGGGAAGADVVDAETAAAAGQLTVSCCCHRGRRRDGAGADGVEGAGRRREGRPGRAGREAAAVHLAAVVDVVGADGLGAAGRVVAHGGRGRGAGEEGEDGGGQHLF
ncbi:hypothetical protein PG990_001723 [Apiospora arundinis]